MCSNENNPIKISENTFDKNIGAKVSDWLGYRFCPVYLYLLLFQRIVLGNSQMKYPCRHPIKFLCKPEEVSNGIIYFMDREIAT